MLPPVWIVSALDRGVLRPERGPSPASGTAVSLGGMSKSFGLAGVRIGWIATRDRALLERLAALLLGSSPSNGERAP